MTNDIDDVGDSPIQLPERISSFEDGIGSRVASLVGRVDGAIDSAHHAVTNLAERVEGWVAGQNSRTCRLR